MLESFATFFGYVPHGWLASPSSTYLVHLACWQGSTSVLIGSNSHPLQCHSCHWNPSHCVVQSHWEVQILFIQKRPLYCSCETQQILWEDSGIRCPHSSDVYYMVSYPLFIRSLIDYSITPRAQDGLLQEELGSITTEKSLGARPACCMSCASLQY